MTVSGSLPRSAHTLDPRFTRGSRFSSLKRAAANSPTPTELDHLDLHGGLVISNRGGVSSLGDNENEEEEEDDEEDVVDGGGVGMEAMMEELKREEEEGVLSLIVDSRMLHKDFIETKFTLAFVCYKRVRLLLEYLISILSVLAVICFK